MEEGMLIIEAKDMAAEKMADGHNHRKKPKKKEKEKGNYTSLMTGISDLLRNWNPETPEGEEYMKDLESLYDGEHTEDEERDEEEY